MSAYQWSWFVRVLLLLETLDQRTHTVGNPSVIFIYISRHTPPSFPINEIFVRAPQTQTHFTIIYKITQNNCKTKKKYVKEYLLSGTEVPIKLNAMTI